MANTNPKTGIPYGVVYLNSLADWVWDEFLQEGNNDSYDAALEQYKADNPQATEEDIEQWGEEYEPQEDSYSLEKDDMSLGLSYLGGAAMVWVFNSPHKATTRQCSPCCPGAGDLNNPDPYGGECYSLPLDWFDGDMGEKIQRGFDYGLTEQQVFEQMNDESQNAAEFATALLTLLRKFLKGTLI